MERQIMDSKKVQRKEEYLPTKQVSDESEQLEKSCLTEEEDACLSDASHSSKKRIREDTTCESKKIKKHKPSEESWFKTLSDDDWLFGNNQQKSLTNNKAAIKNDEDMIMKLLQKSYGDSLFPKAQFLPQFEIFVLPYTVPF
ncbi:hypothetical protein ISN44_As07g024980 [Arabidopsis suecica]|uniref:Uncharacterized protein n=1 Tax=Arabidopsis suecica TaxID=45249 RepID=A0A8T2BUV8_ARASU|nr:hypothetical protein ISN44_As07g024980 [Arabidopsis suecica]